MGSFQEWANFSAGILHTMGEYSGLLGNREEVKDRDSDTAEYTLMLVRARQHFDGAPFLAKELWAALALEDVPHCITAGTERSAGASPIRRMGRLLVKLKGQPFGEEGLTVQEAGVKDHVGLYRVETRAERDAIHRNLKSTE
jgi:hypothetical protein